MLRCVKTHSFQGLSSDSALYFDQADRHETFVKFLCRGSWKVMACISACSEGVGLRVKE